MSIGTVLLQTCVPQELNIVLGEEQGSKLQCKDGRSTSLQNLLGSNLLLVKESHVWRRKLIGSWLRRSASSHSTARSRTKAVELCELIISNRRLVSQRNPVKRRLIRDLAMSSLLTGFEARLWKVVFKHLRTVCDHRSTSAHLLAFFSRILFAHADIDGLSASPAAKDRGDVAPWEQTKTTFSSSGHRNTYAAAFTDVRGWALRKLLRRPRDFGLTLLCAHFCIIASQSPCLRFVRPRSATWSHDLVLKGMTFLQRYRRLRLRAAGIVPQADEDLTGARLTAATHLPPAGTQQVVYDNGAPLMIPEGFSGY
eukprot:Skav233557  [mRNA]  locus=scaffold563:481368:491948:+ [translate_table: standard]